MVRLFLFCGLSRRSGKRKMFDFTFCAFNLSRHERGVGDWWKSLRGVGGWNIREEVGDVSTRKVSGSWLHNHFFPSQPFADSELLLLPRKNLRKYFSIIQTFCFRSRARLTGWSELLMMLLSENASYCSARSFHGCLWVPRRALPEGEWRNANAGRRIWQERRT